MKIIHVIPDATVNFGGPVSTMSNIMSVLKSMGHTVEALAIEKSGKVMPVAGPLHRLPASFPGRFGNSRWALSWLEGHLRDVDVVFFHSVWSGINIRLAQLLRRNQRRYIVVPHGSLDPFDLRKKAIAKRILGPALIRPYLEGSAAVICSAQREVDSLVTYGAKCNVIMLPWPVSRVPCADSREEDRRLFGFHANEFVVLSLGRIDPVKGFPVLLPAFQRLANAGIKTRLVIAGPDSRDYTAVVRQMVQRLGLNQIVTLMPPILGDEKRRLMKAADCFALPSLHENFGVAIIEAMQQALPCVISNNVYICDELERGGAALVCNYNEKEVFLALQKLAENFPLRAKMSAAAISVAQSFEPEVLKDHYLAKLRAILHPSS